MRCWSRGSIGNPAGPGAYASLASPPARLPRANQIDKRWRCRHWPSSRVKQPVHSARPRGPEPNRAGLGRHAPETSRESRMGRSVWPQLSMMSLNRALADSFCRHVSEDVPAVARAAWEPPAAAVVQATRHTGGLRQRLRGPSQEMARAPQLPPEVASDHLRILVTRPAPTVRPPSRMANLSPSSIAMG